jgi:hypothetical protein
MPKYTNQIVVFLDILGVKNKLFEFETEALNNKDSGSPVFHESQRLNRLLEMFRESLSLIRESECNHYVFSDNICINISYITDEAEKPDLLIEILILISRLTGEFAREGYFLRGGIDVGWFLNYPEIAVGVPLAKAYYLESKKAVYPRVLLSKDFSHLIDQYLKEERIRDEFERLPQLYIKRDRSFSFVNPFYFILQYEDKISKTEFLKEYSDNIKLQIKDKRHRKRVKKKYLWLAFQFDSFLSEYLSSYKDLDNPDLDFTSQEILALNGLKIFDIKIPLWLINICPALGFVSKK